MREISYFLRSFRNVISTILCRKNKLLLLILSFPLTDLCWGRVVWGVNNRLPFSATSWLIRQRTWTFRASSFELMWTGVCEPWFYVESLHDSWIGKAATANKTLRRWYPSHISLRCSGSPSGVSTYTDVCVCIHGLCTPKSTNQLYSIIYYFKMSLTFCFKFPFHLLHL